MASQKYDDANGIIVSAAVTITGDAFTTLQKAAEDFIYWLFTSETGKAYVKNDLELIAPFDTFSENEAPEDPLAQEIIKWMNKDNINTIPWNFTVFPSLAFKNDFGSALLQYAQGTKNWNEVKNVFVNRWKSESK